MVEKNEANVNIADLGGDTALHYACRLKAEDIAKQHSGWKDKTQTERKEIIAAQREVINKILTILIEHGANINAVGKNSLTPLASAIQNSSFEAVEYLFSMKELDILAINNDQGIYHHLSDIVVSEAGLKIFSAILKMVSNTKNLLNIVDHEGFTPLHHIFKKFTAGAQHILDNKLEELKHES